MDALVRRCIGAPTHRNATVATEKPNVTRHVFQLEVIWMYYVLSRTTQKNNLRRRRNDRSRCNVSEHGESRVKQSALNGDGDTRGVESGESGDRWLCMRIRLM